MATPPRRDASILSGPAGQMTIRDHNLALVLQHVGAAGESSRAHLAETTGLNKTTVSSLVAELIERRLLAENGLRRKGSVGRPAVRVRLEDECYVAIGLELNVDYLACNVVDLSGQVRKQHFDVGDNRRRDPEDVLGRLASLVDMTLEELQPHGLTPIGAVMAVAGLVDSSRRRLLLGPNLGWGDVEIASMLEESLAPRGITVTMDNEANLAALAERWYGVGRHHRDFLHLSGEVGVGAGLIIDGALHRGATGFGGEFGHMTLEPDGPPCACGSNGCVETYVGLEAMLRAVGFDVEQSLTDPRTADVGPAARIAAAALAGDPTVLEGLATIGETLGGALASAVNLVAPSAIVLGGYFAPLHPWLAPPIQQQLDRRVLSSAHHQTEVLRSELERGAAVRGAAEALLRDVLANPGRLPPQESRST